MVAEGLLSVGQLVVGLVVVVAAVAGAAVYIRSSLVQQRHRELKDLADTRADRIAELEKKVEEQGHRIHQLEGQMQAIQAIKAKEIALEVVRMLKEPHDRVF